MWWCDKYSIYTVWLSTNSWTNSRSNCRVDVSWTNCRSNCWIDSQTVKLNIRLMVDPTTDPTLQVTGQLLCWTQKPLKAALSDIIPANRVRVVGIIYSLEAVFKIAYGLLLHFIICLPARLTAWWVTCSQLAYEVDGSHPGVILLFCHNKLQVSFTL